MLDGSPPPTPPLQLVSAMKPATARPRLITGKLDLDVGCLDHRDRGHARLEIQLVDRLTGEERHEAVRAGLDLHLRSDPIFDDACHDARKAIARRLLDRCFA